MTYLNIEVEGERKIKIIETKENINSDSYIEEVAREKLDLVMPYEIIFVDHDMKKGVAKRQHPFYNSVNS